MVGVPYAMAEVEFIVRLIKFLKNLISQNCIVCIVSNKLL